MCALLLWNQHFDSENQLSVYFTIMKSTFCKSLQVAIGWLIPKYSFPYISCSYTELETSACYFRYNQVDVLRHLDRSSVLPIHLNWYREPMIGHSFFFFFFFFNIEVQWLSPSSLKQRVKTSGKLKVHFSSHKLIYAFSRILLLLKAKFTGNKRIIQKWPFYSIFLV